MVRMEAKMRHGANKSRGGLLDRCLREERGDVLMEYVLLTVMIVLPLVGVSVGLVNVNGETFSPDGAVTGEDFGLLGNAFVQRFRMVMSGVCLPLP